jgi:tetratricopeptide (TPR) repeat protein
MRLLYAFSCLLLGVQLYGATMPSNHAKAAYEAGDFQTAFALFEPLYEHSPEDAELNFYLGRCALELRRYDEAAAAFDRVLILNPDHTRTHLELARLYYEQHQLELARNELSIALKSNLPEDVHNRATAFKHTIDDSLSPHRFSGALILGGGFDSNVNNDIGNHEFTLPSLDLPISGKSKEKDGYLFSTFVLSHIYAPEDTGGWRLENGFVAYDKLYSKSSQNNLVLFSLSSAPTWSDSTTKIALPVALDRIYIDGKGYLYNAGIGAKGHYLLDASSMIEGGYTFKEGFYRNETYDVKTHLFFTDYRRDIGDHLFSFALQANYALNREQEAIRTDVEYNELKYGVELSKEWTKAFKSRAEYTKATAYYRDEDTLFLNKRKDKIDTYELALSYMLSDNITVGMSVSYSDHRSNQAPYDYDKINALANIGWIF